VEKAASHHNVSAKKMKTLKKVSNCSLGMRSDIRGCFFAVVLET
jgi:hypothetical protein